MFAITRKRSAFSLIELVIVVVIIGIIAAIAIPRMSRGAVGANESTLTGNLAILRKALDLYAAEHNGAFPTDSTTIVGQLTTYTDGTGNVSATRVTPFIYGPYLKTIPVLTVGAARGQSAIVATQGGVAAGWVYAGGVISANCDATEKDINNVKYNAY